MNSEREAVTDRQRLIILIGSVTLLLVSAGGMYLVESVEDVKKMQVKRPDFLAFVTQTTLSMDDTAEVIDALRETVGCPDYRVTTDCVVRHQGQGILYSPGGDRLAHAATRNMSCCAVSGQGAGVAAALAVKARRDVAEVDVTAMQAELQRQGVRIH